MMTLQMTAVTMRPVWLELLLRGLPLLGGPPSSLQEHRNVSPTLSIPVLPLQTGKLLKRNSTPLTMGRSLSCCQHNTVAYPKAVQHLHLHAEKIKVSVCRGGANTQDRVCHGNANE